MKFGQTPRETRSIPGKVYLVGAGPGAPDLITLRAAEILKRADVVFHDALVHPDTLLLAQNAEKIAVGKRCGNIQPRSVLSTSVWRTPRASSIPWCASRAATRCCSAVLRKKSLRFGPPGSTTKSFRA